MENSKSELITWINNLLKGNPQNITKIEQLGNGVAYCKLLTLIEPTSLNPAKIILKPKTQIDHINNLKLFQGAMQKLHLKKNFDIDKVSKCFFHENYDLAIYLKKQYTLRFQGQNKENTSLNGSFEKVLNLSLPEPEKPSEEQIKIEKITAIIQTLGTADNKITQICEVLGIQPPLLPSPVNVFESGQKQGLFQTDSKRQQQIIQQEKKTSMLCETPHGDEMLLDPVEQLFSGTSQNQQQKQSSSKLIMKLQSNQVEKKETPNFFATPVPQEQSLADFIKSESKQQQQYMQQYSMQKQMQMQNQLQQQPFQSPFRDIVQQNPFPNSYRRDLFYSSKDIQEE